MNAVMDQYLWKSIQDRFTRHHHHNILSDIWDGEEYRRFAKKGGFLSSQNPANVSFTMNTDGVSIFHSSKVRI